MSEKSVDRRVRKTKKQLRQGLTKLLQEKPVKDITVRELADEVDINRGTFYLHYRDVFDMVEQIEQELFVEFSEILNHGEGRVNEPDPKYLLESIFKFLDSNADMAEVLLGAHGDMAFVDKLKELVRDKCLHDWMNLFDTDKSDLFEPYFAFVVGGVISLFQTWLETGRRQTAHEMAQMAQHFIVDGVKALGSSD